MGGKNKLPLEIKINKGTFRKHRDANKGFEAPKLNPKEVISVMTEREQKWFDSMHEKLEITGVLKDTDLYALEVLAKARATMEECDEVMREKGRTIIAHTRDGAVERKSPYHQMYIDAYNIFNQLTGKFGMTPSDRGKIAQPKSDQDDESDLSKLLRERNE